MRAACVLLLALTSVASAGPVVTWNAPATCPNTEDVHARIERRLGAPLALHGIAVDVKLDGTTFVARIDTRAVTVANQIRVLRSARCDELADAVAVVIARLALEQRASARPVDFVEGDVVERPRLQVPPLVFRNRSPASRYGFGVHAMALSGIGTVPRVGVGGEFSIFGRRDDLFAEVGFARWATRSTYLVMDSPGRVDLGLDVATARFGYSPARKPLRAWLGTEYGEMRGQGRGLALPMEDDTTRWLAITSGVSIGWPMSRYARLVGTFEVAVPTTPATFYLSDGTTNVYTSSPAAARCALGLELGMP